MAYNTEIKEVLQKVSDKVDKNISLEKRLYKLEKMCYQYSKLRRQHLIIWILTGLLTALVSFNIFFIILAAITQPPIQSVEQINNNQTLDK
jgi:hypothetical protein